MGTKWYKYISIHHPVSHNMFWFFQEMTNLKQPLTAISTPQKADHFPFPNSLVVSGSFL